MGTLKADCLSTLADYLSHCDLTSRNAGNFIAAETSFEHITWRASFDAMIALEKAGCDDRCALEEGRSTYARYGHLPIRGCENQEERPPVNATALSVEYSPACRATALAAARDSYARQVQRIDLAACDRVVPACFALLQAQKQGRADAQRFIHMRAAEAARKSIACGEYHDPEVDQAFLKLAAGDERLEGCWDNLGRTVIDPNCSEPEFVEVGQNCEYWDDDEDGEPETEHCFPEIKMVEHCNPTSWILEEEDLPCTRAEFSGIELYRYSSERELYMTEQERQHEFDERKACVVAFEGEIAKREAVLSQEPAPPALDAIRESIPRAFIPRSEEICVDSAGRFASSYALAVSLADLIADAEKQNGHPIDAIIPKGMSLDDLCRQQMVQSVTPGYAALQDLIDATEAELEALPLPLPVVNAHWAY